MGKLDQVLSASQVLFLKYKNTIQKLLHKLLPTEKNQAQHKGEKKILCPTKLPTPTSIKTIVRPSG